MTKYLLTAAMLKTRRARDNQKASISKSPLKKKKEVKDS